MRLAFIGNFHNYGKSLATAGTSIVYLLSDLDDIESIDIYCSSPNRSMEKSFVPDKVKIIPTYSSKNPLSTFRLFYLKRKEYDLVLFNILPTTFGRSSLINLIGLIAPVFLSKVRKMNVKVIYHNSTFTNDIRALGYTKPIDKFRKFLLSRIERVLLNSVHCLLPLHIYVEEVSREVKRARVSYIDLRNLDGFPTLFINHLNKNEYISRSRTEMKTLLMHGFWGPQKNLDLALRCLSDLRAKGMSFYLILSGSINTNFPQYKIQFDNLIKKYSGTIDELVGYVDEKDIFSFFTKADCVIIPYVTPGGQSGVLATAMVFDNHVIGIKHREFEEQSLGQCNITLTTVEDFCETVRSFLNEPVNNQISYSVGIEKKILNAKTTLWSAITDTQDFGM